MRKTEIQPDTATGSKLATNGAPLPLGTKRDVARLAQRSLRSVSAFMEAGMPYMKLSERCVRFDLPECAQWLKTKYGTARIGKENRA